MLAAGREIYTDERALPASRACFEYALMLRLSLDSTIA